jgi:hydroxypyruvate isomerase
MTRRHAIKTATLATAACATLTPRQAGAAEDTPAPLAGRIHHSVCRWCYEDLSLDMLCAGAKKLGLQSVEILKLEDLPTLKNHGLICAMLSGVPGDIQKGLNRLENHDAISAFFEKTIPLAADAGCPNLICFSGNRQRMSDEEGLANCATGIKRFIAVAEKNKVNVCMELLNSKVNHPDYMCDHTAWGLELCRQVGSERFKLLYDIYHMQIMEGDVIRTIQTNHQYIGHYHTGGVPGRHEIDETQELYYPAIMKAIVKTGYQGFVAQEFVPTGSDPLGSLAKCVRLCDV